MNARKLAEALRMAAEALDEGGDEPARLAPAPPPKPSPRRHGKRPAYVPTAPVDELTAARARQALAKAGMVPLK